MLHANKNQTTIENQRQSVLLTNICDDLSKKSYSVQRNALPKTLLNLLFDHVKCENNTPYHSAGIGRSADFHQNQNIRNDKIAWIDDVHQLTTNGFPGWKRSAWKLTANYTWG